MKRSILILIFLMACIVNSQAQFGRILQKANDRVIDKLSDKIADAIAEEITNQATKPIDEAMDEMLEEQYKQDSTDGKTNKNYGDFLASITQTVDLPGSYSFDMTLDIETKDYKGKKYNSKLHLDKLGNLLAIEQDEDDDVSIIVLDLENDIMAMYSENKDGEKQVIAMSSLLTSGFMTETMVADSMTITKTGKSRTVAGYNCNEYLIEDKSTTSKAFIAEDFPVNYHENMKSLMKKSYPTAYRDEMPTGIMLQSETKTKKKNKKSSFEVKKVIDIPSTINNSDYEKKNLGE